MWRLRPSRERTITWNTWSHPQDRISHLQRRLPPWALKLPFSVNPRKKSDNRKSAKVSVLRC